MRGILSWIGVALAMAVGLGAGRMQMSLAPPGQREFIKDQARIITPEDREKIRAMCDKLLTEKATPIIVVTINSMAEHGGDGLRIETFATLLFDQWQIGHAKLHGQDWNTGILLLVSTGDRKARIELGAGWGRQQDALARQIMDEQIIPRFKEGNYSAGILAGVESLDKLARGLELPRAKRPMWHYLLWVAFIGLAIFTVVSLIRRGSGGWAWVFWTVLFAAIGYLLITMLSSRSRGGGFGGGSFGGGFSGGGGASGSW